MRTVNVIEGIFFAALEKQTPVERNAYLDEACTGDAELRRCVERMLDAQPKIGDFLQRAAPAPSATIDEPPLAERPGAVIGPYKLLQELGEGGFGVVFLAEQRQPVRRKVALKIIKPGMDSKQVIARFEAERQALALMDHPNIARVLDGGTTDSGRPSFVMELVKGVPITEFCDKNRLTPRERLELFIPVCQAVQHAHQKGIIHRDLKPNNVLVTLYDDKPVPKVIDFGIAKAIEQKLTEQTLFTRVGQVIGTLEYMSPEQASLNALDVDTRSDVYALGVLLYELLTGTTPLNKEQLEGVAFMELLRLVREQEPPRPSTRLSQSGGGLPLVAAYRKSDSQKLPKLVKGELDWIAMKALEKDRSRRYATASALAADVQRYLTDEQVEACPPSVGYRLRKYARKHKTAAAMIGMAAALLLVGSLVSGWEAVRATRAETLATDRLDLALRNEEKAKKSEKAAEEERDNVRHANEALRRAGDEMRANQYAWDMQAVPIAWEAGHVHQAWQMLDRQDLKLRGFEWHVLDQQTRGGVVTIELPDANKRHRGMWTFSDDGARVAEVVLPAPSPAGDNTLPSVTVWNVASRQKLFTHVMVADDVKLLRTFRSPLVIFSPDGKRIGIMRPNLNPTDPPGISAVVPFHVQILDVVTGKVILNDERKDVRLPPTLDLQAWFSPNGSRFAFMAAMPIAESKSLRKVVRIWDVDGGKEPVTIPCAAVADWPFDPDGSRFVVRVPDGKKGRKLKAYDSASGKELRTWEIPGKLLEISPDGKQLASVVLEPLDEGETKESHMTLHVWDAATEKKLHSLALPPAPTSYALGLYFNRDGTRLTFHMKASYDSADDIIAFDPVAGKRLGTMSRPAANVGFERSERKNPPLFSPDGTQLVVPAGNSVTTWNVATGKLLRTLRGHIGRLAACCITPDGRLMRSVSDEGTLKEWDLRIPEPIVLAVGVGVSPFTKMIASTDGGTIAVHRFVSAMRTSELRVWDVSTAKGPKILTAGPLSEAATAPKAPRSLASAAFAFSHNGGRVALARGWTPSEVKVDGAKDPRLPAALAGDLTVWDVASEKELFHAKVPEPGYLGFEHLALSPDGASVAVAFEDKLGDGNYIKIFDVDSGSERRTIQAGRSRFYNLCFSPNGRSLAGILVDADPPKAPGSSQLTLWDVATGSPNWTVKMDLDGFGASSLLVSTGSPVWTVKKDVGPIAWSRDGTRLAAGRTLFAAATGMPTATLEIRQGWVTSLAFSRDGQRIAGTIELPQLLRSAPLVKVWDTVSGRELLAPRTTRTAGQSREICRVAFTPDGHRLLHFDIWSRGIEAASIVITTWDATPREVTK
jgi:serine/threonine protein kinase/WD40 repeat protein